MLTTLLGRVMQRVNDSGAFSGGAGSVIQDWRYSPGDGLGIAGGVATEVVTVAGFGLGIAPVVVAGLARGRVYAVASIVTDKV